jgi:hypothetical protein
MNAEGSRTDQKAEEDANKCFGAPHEKEGKTGWESAENLGQVD